MEKGEKFSVYAKVSLFLVGTYALLSMLYIAQQIILPLIFAVLISILLGPVIAFLMRLKISRVFSIAITLLFTMVLIVAFCLFIFSQIKLFSASWPVLVVKFSALWNQVVRFIPGFLDISPQDLNVWIDQTLAQLLNSGQAAIGKTIISVGGGIVVLFLIPVYVFFILYYQPLLSDVIRKLFSKNHQRHVNEVFTQTKNVVKRYLVGLLIEAIIVSILNAVGLLIIGLDYAILLGILAALLNVIPYVGGIVGLALPMIVALATKSPISVLYVVIVYYAVQLIDNNYIVPKIVASKVRINALVSIFVVIAGGALWGIPGMFLSIPLTAILKVMFDHIDALKPWGLLLGDEMPKATSIESQ